MVCRAWLILASTLALACGSDDTAPAGDTGGTGTGTAGSTAGDTVSEPTSAGTMAGTTTTVGASSGDTGPVADSGSDTSSADTDACPAGTDGCPCDAGRTCDAGLSCNVDGMCEPASTCRPIDTDPHADEASALMLGAVGCDSQIDLGTVGTLDGPETDWYRYFGNEGVILCSEEPRAVVTAAINTEVCVYIECLEGSASGLGCGGGAASATSPDGRPGCCGTNQAHISGFECGGLLTSKNADVWISIASAEDACIDYDLAYEY